MDTGKWIILVILVLMLIIFIKLVHLIVSAQLFHSADLFTDLSFIIISNTAYNFFTYKVLIKLLFCLTQKLNKHFILVDDHLYFNNKHLKIVYDHLYFYNKHFIVVYDHVYFNNKL